MNFGMTPEQDMIVNTVRSFVETEIYPHENEVERTGHVPKELGQEIARKVKELGFFACNLPEDVGGGGRDHTTFTLVERELGRGSMGLTVFFGRPSGILMACNTEQREKYLIPAAKGDKFDALAMTEGVAKPVVLLDAICPLHILPCKIGTVLKTSLKISPRLIGDQP